MTPETERSARSLSSKATAIIRRADREAAKDDVRDCRECHRARPAKKFDDGATVCKKCRDRGRGKSVRTVSGGLPTLGRRR